MSDLTPEQQEAYLKARELARPKRIEKTLAALDHAANGAGLLDIRDVCRDAAATIRGLQHKLALERAVAGSDGQERILLLIAENKRLRNIVRGLAALGPLAALDGGQMLCWACGVVTPVTGPPFRDGVELAPSEVISHAHRDDTVAHLPACPWLLAATYESATELDPEVTAETRHAQQHRDEAAEMELADGRAQREPEPQYVPLDEAVARLDMSQRLVVRLIADDELTVQVRVSDIERLLAVRGKIGAGLDGVEMPERGPRQNHSDG